MILQYSSENSYTSFLERRNKESKQSVNSLTHTHTHTSRPSPLLPHQPIQHRHHMGTFRNRALQTWVIGIARKQGDEL